MTTIGGSWKHWLILGGVMCLLQGGSARAMLVNTNQTFYGEYLTIEWQCKKQWEFSNSGTILNLSQQNISWIDSFVHLHLQELNLSSNALSSLPEKFFSEIPNLRVLNLSDNRISSLSEISFKNLLKLETLDLSRNPFKTGEALLCIESLKQLFLKGTCGLNFFVRPSSQPLTEISVSYSTFSNDEGDTEIHKEVEVCQDRFANRVKKILNDDFEESEDESIFEKAFLKVTQVLSAYRAQGTNLLFDDQTMRSFAEIVSLFLDFNDNLGGVENTENRRKSYNIEIPDCSRVVHGCFCDPESFLDVALSEEEKGEDKYLPFLRMYANGSFAPDLEKILEDWLQKCVPNNNSRDIERMCAAVSAGMREIHDCRREAWIEKLRPQDSNPSTIEALKAFKAQAYLV